MQLLWISELNKNMMLLFLPPKCAHAQARNLGIFLGSSHSTTFHGQLINTFGSFYLLIISQGFPGGSEAKNPPANAGDVGLIPELAVYSLWSHKRVKNNLATERQFSLKIVLSTPNPARHPRLDWGIFCLPPQPPH